MSKITILSACHNNAAHLSQYFQSLLTQTFNDFEVIFVDDASTDNSLKIANQLRDERFKIISLDNRQYCASAYAEALKHANSEICAVVDADDGLIPKAIAKILNAYENNKNIDYFYSQHYWCDENLVIKKKGISGIPSGGRSLVDMASINRHCFSHWRTFRTYLRDKANIFPQGLKYSVDKNMGFTLEEIGQGAFLPSALYLYRYHRNNMSKTHAGDQKRQTKSLVQEFQKRRANRKINIFPIIKIK